MARLFAPEAPIREVVVEKESAPTEVVIERGVPERERVVTKARTIDRKRAA